MCRKCAQFGVYLRKCVCFSARLWLSPVRLFLAQLVDAAQCAPADVCASCHPVRPFLSSQHPEASGRQIHVVHVTGCISNCSCPGEQKCSRLLAARRTSSLCHRPKVSDIHVCEGSKVVTGCLALQFDLAAFLYFSNARPT